MKKFFAGLFSLTLALMLCSCGIRFKKVNVEVPDFSIEFNGKTVDKALLADTQVYSVKIKTVNTEGTREQFVYTGYKIADILNKLDLDGTVTSAYAVGTDGFVREYTDTSILKDAMFAFNKVKTDGSETYNNGPWFAPLSSNESPNYAKKLSKIYYNGLNGEQYVSSAVQDGEFSFEAKSNITFDPFEFYVGETKVTNETLADLTVYKAKKVTVWNKNRTESYQNDYTGYKLKDVLNKLGVTSTNLTLHSSKGDVEITEEQLNDPCTMIAIEVNRENEGTSFTFAPCGLSDYKPDYCSGVTKIVIGE